LPLANLYEFSSMLCLASVSCWLIVLWKTGARPLGLFVMTPVALLAFIAGTVLWIPAGPVMPSLNSYWKWIHVTTVSISGSVLLVSGAASVMYLLRHRFDRKVSDTPDEELLATSVWGRLPNLQLLDKIAYRTAIVAFPLYTFAVIAGSLWAEVAWGKYWSWDPKETVAFVSWVFYAGYLHARATSGWRGVRSASINICGFAAIVFNLFFVNFVISGLHSYAGVG
ncbi:MAG: c-type cytochrome biogenesis protein CcsB, partial [Actinomycetota bacterium]|nr:c-type cytochrome biogenesis protein CcsB [Actinomycetota bacterium]